jgi:prolyl-tRNA editing enzyme YbaK/EbsC (Cys-tRNA(Pro) deacylase)
MAADAEGASTARVRAALLAAGHADTIMAFPDGTRTSEDAAAAVGCSVAQIAKSMIFRPRGPECGRPVLVLTSGANRVDASRVAAALGFAVKRAEADWVRDVTGFAIGGVSPVGLLTTPIVLLDEDLLPLDPVWAAAGSPHHVFRTTPGELLRMTGARVVGVRVGG